LTSWVHVRLLRRAYLLAGVVLALLVGASAAAASDAQHVGVLPDGGVWEADLPSNWNGTLLLFSHGYGPTTPQDAPDSTTQQDLIDAGYALAGSSYDPKGSLWALNSAVRDQFQTLTAVKSTVLPSPPRRVIAIGQSMGGLISALEDEGSDGRLDGVLTTCGLVAGGVNLENYQLNGSWAISALLAPSAHIQLVGYQTPAQAAVAAEELQQAAQSAQNTPQGRARLALASALYNVPTWTTTNLLNQNTNPLVPPASQPAAPTDYNEQELEQYYTQYAPGSIVLAFIQTGRASIEQAVGGQPAWNANVDYAKLLASSPYKAEVSALYEQAGIDLDADLGTLTKGANIKAQLPALRNLNATSVATGKLQVPELAIHTIADQLIPVQQENYYATQVAAAGSSQLLRQAYVGRQGHCNFTPAEIIAALHALEHRLTTGQWGDATSAESLQAAALSLNEGDAAYVPYTPPPLTTTNGPFNPETQGYTR
jgi:alpha-beta hydrolase superfamily lysophospholipase